MQIEQRRFTFTSDSFELVGDLRLPAAIPEAGAPAIVFTGPFTGVKEQVTGLYAARLAEAGYVTLAFDHRRFGESSGTPRQHEDAAGKLADLRDAVTHLGAIEEVDGSRIAVCGICLGTAYALKFAAFDPRVRGLALVAGAYNNPYDMRAGMGEDGYRAQLERFAAVARDEALSGEVPYLPAVADAGGEAAMGGQEPYDYYGTERSASPHWRNRVTLSSIRELITLDAAMAADFITPTPVLMVHGRTDGYCSPAAAAAVFERMGKPKELVWLDTSNHIDLYDRDVFVGPAVERIAAWFDRHLREPAAV
jgi:uncharacterized protein